MRPPLVVPSVAAAVAAAVAAMPVGTEVAATTGIDVVVTSMRRRWTLRTWTVWQKRPIPVRAVLSSAVQTPLCEVARSSWGAVLVQADHERPCLCCTVNPGMRDSRLSSSTASLALVRFCDRCTSGLWHFKRGVHPAQRGIACTQN